MFYFVMHDTELARIATCQPGDLKTFLEHRSVVMRDMPAEEQAAAAAKLMTTLYQEDQQFNWSDGLVYLACCCAVTVLEAEGLLDQALRDQGVRIEFLDADHVQVGQMTPDFLEGTKQALATAETRPMIPPGATTPGTGTIH